MRGDVEEVVVPYWRLGVLLLVFVVGVFAFQFGVLTGFVTLDSEKEVFLSDLIAGEEMFLEVGDVVVLREDEDFKLTLDDSDSMFVSMSLDSSLGSEDISLLEGESDIIDVGVGDLEIEFVGTSAVNLVINLKLEVDGSTDLRYGDSDTSGSSGGDSFGFGSFGSRSSGSSGSSGGSSGSSGGSLGFGSSDDEESISPWKPGDPEIVVKDGSFLGGIQDLVRDRPVLVFGSLFGFLFIVLIGILIAWQLGAEKKTKATTNFYRPTPGRQKAAYYSEFN